ncbi:MAG: hypothetical protein ACYDC4_00365 [Candidatus Dormibacteria bacterium]
MVWLWWHQHRADRAEGQAIRRYLEWRAAQQQRYGSVGDARRQDDATARLNTPLGGDPGH